MKKMMKDKQGQTQGVCTERVEEGEREIKAYFCVHAVMCVCVCVCVFVCVCVAFYQVCVTYQCVPHTLETFNPSSVGCVEGFPRCHDNGSTSSSSSSASPVSSPVATLLT